MKASVNKRVGSREVNSALSSRTRQDAITGDSEKQLMRAGLRIRGRSIDPTVRRAVIKFAKWLRQEYEFPIRVPVYLFPSEVIMNSKRKRVSATFFGPFSKNIEPYIRVATGDYFKLKARIGRNDALASILCSIGHEVVHYQQWCKTGDTSERGVAKKAVDLVDRYALTVSRP